MTSVPDACVANRSDEVTNLTPEQIDALLGRTRTAQEVEAAPAPATLNNILAELREINQTIANTQASLLLANERTHTEVQLVKRMVYDVWRSCWFQCPCFFFFPCCPHW